MGIRLNPLPSEHLQSHLSPQRTVVLCLSPCEESLPEMLLPAYQRFYCSVTWIILSQLNYEWRTSLPSKKAHQKIARLCPNHISAAQSCQLRGSLWWSSLTFIGKANSIKVCGFDLFAALHWGSRPWDVEGRCTTWSWKWDHWRQSAFWLRDNHGHNSPRITKEKEKHYFIAPTNPNGQSLHSHIVRKLSTQQLTPIEATVALTRTNRPGRQCQWNLLKIPVAEQRFRWSWHLPEAQWWVWSSLFSTSFCSTSTAQRPVTEETARKVKPQHLTTDASSKGTTHSNNSMSTLTLCSL